MRKLRENDEVVVLAGKDKGKTGKLKKVYWNANKVVVDGVNMQKKHVRPTQENPEGGIVDMEGKIHISNVAVVSPKTKKATRVRIESRDGKKVRVAVACGSVLA